MLYTLNKDPYDNRDKYIRFRPNSEPIIYQIYDPPNNIESFNWWDSIKEKIRRLWFR